MLYGCRFFSLFFLITQVADHRKIVFMNSILYIWLFKILLHINLHSRSYITILKISTINIMFQFFVCRSIGCRRMRKAKKFILTPVFGKNTCRMPFSCFCFLMPQKTCCSIPFLFQSFTSNKQSLRPTNGSQAFFDYSTIEQGIFILVMPSHLFLDPRQAAAPPLTSFLPAAFLLI